MPVLRIPGLVLSKRGTLLAFCEARTGSMGLGPRDRSNTDIVMKRSEDMGMTWGPLRFLGPVLVRESGVIGQAEPEGGA